MESESLRKKIVFTPLAFIVAVIFLSSFYYIRILQNYHDVNINNLVKEYNERQYEKIKNDVDRIVNFLDYATKYKSSLSEIEKKALDRVNNIDMTTSPYMFILKLIKPSGGDDFAKVIFYNSRPLAVGKLISSNKVDKDNKHFLEKVIKDIQNNGYSYAIYKHEKAKQKTINKKLTYFYLYEPLQWIITSSVYLDEVKKEIEKKELELENHIRKTIYLSLALLFIFSLLVVVVFYKISNQVYQRIRKHEHKLKLLATTDELTGAYNRRAFLNLLRKNIFRAKRYHEPLSLMICDVDFFKKINDTYGHGTGDKILKLLVKIVFTNIRQDDLLSRWGGEEFIILLPQTPSKPAVDLAERLRRSIAEYDFPKVGRVTVSFGLTEFIIGDDAESFIKRADDALYVAKANGRNRVEFIR